MDVATSLLQGFAVALSPINLLWCFVGVFLGTAVGVMPGLGPPATIAMLLPLTFQMNPTSAMIMLAGIYYGAKYGGSTTYPSAPLVLGLVLGDSLERALRQSLMMSQGDLSILVSRPIAAVMLALAAIVLVVPLLRRANPSPPAAPPAVVAYWEDVFARLAQTATWKKYIEDNQFEDAFQKSGEFSAFIDQFTERQRGILKEAGVKVVR